MAQKESKILHFTLARTLDNSDLLSLLESYEDAHGHYFSSIVVRTIRKQFKLVEIVLVGTDATAYELSGNDTELRRLFGRHYIRSMWECNKLVIDRPKRQYVSINKRWTVSQQEILEARDSVVLRSVSE